MNGEIIIVFTFKVDCDVINDVYVWAADDTVLHIEVDRPLKVYDTVDYQDHCDVEVMTKEELESHQFDHTQLSASWLKKEFKEKVSDKPDTRIKRISLR